MAIPKNLLPASLMKKPKTFEEFQEFFFYWEPNLPFTEHSYAEDEDSEGYQYPKEDVKEFKLILWNARKIKKLTNEIILRNIRYDLQRKKTIEFLLDDRINEIYITSNNQNILDIYNTIL